MCMQRACIKIFFFLFSFHEIRVVAGCQHMHVNGSLKREPDGKLSADFANWCQIIMTLDSLNGVAVQEMEPLM